MNRADRELVGFTVDLENRRVGWVFRRKSDGAERSIIYDIDRNMIKRGNKPAVRVTNAMREWLTDFGEWPRLHSWLGFDIFSESELDEIRRRRRRRRRADIFDDDFVDPPES